MNKADAARIWRLNFQFSTEVLNEATPGLERLNLEAKEFFVLDGVENRPYPAELALYLSMPRPTMTLYLKNLHAKGFISRVIDSADLRRHRLEMTSAGGKTVREARNILSDRYLKRLSSLTGEEQSQFARLLEKLTS